MPLAFPPSLKGLPLTDFTAFQQMAQAIANNILEFPLLIELVVGTIMLAPFVDAALQTFGASS